MNWGLFLGLLSFLLPLSLAGRLVLFAIASRAPLSDDAQATRFVLFAFLLAIMVTRLPVTMYAVRGDFQTLGRITEDFMLSPLGIAQMVCIVAGVFAADVFGIAERIDDGMAAGSMGYKSVGIILICLVLGWVGAR